MGKKLSAINALTLSKLNSYIFKFMRFYLGKKFPQVHDEIQKLLDLPKKDAK